MKILQLACRRLLPFLFIIPLLPAPLKAKEKRSMVKGIVKNETGAPLANVSVIVHNGKTNFSAGTTTNSAGIFSCSRLPAGSNYSFTISYVGYETQTLNGYALKDDATFSLVAKLRESSKTLEDIVVIGYGTAK